MTEGWHNEDYLVLYSEEEADRITSSYGLRDFLPDYTIVGLRGWDDFIVIDSARRVFTVPTVPLSSQYLAPYEMPADLTVLQQDERFTKKIKWYLKPLVFGGKSEVGENLVWISGDEHIQLVRWWNEKYRDVKKERG